MMTIKQLISKLKDHNTIWTRRSKAAPSAPPTLAPVPLAVSYSTPTNSAHLQCTLPSGFAGRVQTAESQGRLLGSEVDQVSLEADQISLKTDQASLKTDQVSLKTNQISLKTDQVSLEVDRVPLEAHQVLLRADQVSLKTDQVLLEADPAPSPPENSPSEEDSILAQLISWLEEMVIMEYEHIERYDFEIHLGVAGMTDEYV